MQNERKGLIPGCNGQYYVRVHDKDEWREIFKWLNENHYDNVHNYTENLYPEHPSVFCIDEKGHIFGGTNGTCMACAVGGGHKIIDFGEFKIRHYWDIFVLTIDIQADHIIFFCQDLDMRCEATLYYKCYRLYFGKENKEKLILALTEGCEENELNFIKAINNRFYFGSHVEDWFKLDEFEKFCSENKIEYFKSIESIKDICAYYKQIESLGYMGFPELREKENIKDEES